ncbi:MAG: XTP/dITP diphosphatase [Ruminococcaceae bacterium]|nr:XTP/dITP diphosphatase [Oscillospiraceae bacterium]
MKVVLASRNKNKVKEIKAIYKAITGSELDILSLDDIGYTDEIEEDGSSFEENAAIKASVPAKLGYIGLADDSGLAVDALGGAPGIYSARYSGECATDAKNNAKLLKNLEGVSDRSAKFVCVFSAVAPDGKNITVRGECPGVIAESESGNGGFGYDPLFIYQPLSKTFGELSSDEKNEVSHRAKALSLLIPKLSEFLDSYKD